MGESIDWGLRDDYGPLQDVLLCRPENFEWLPTSSISKDTLRRGLKFDPELAQRQHREMVQAYEDAGLRCHFLEPDPNLPYQVYALDSSFMTDMSSFLLGGGGVYCMCQSLKRG